MFEAIINYNLNQPRIDVHVFLVYAQVNPIIGVSSFTQVGFSFGNIPYSLYS